jgi:hypothetical protein
MRDLGGAASEKSPVLLRVGTWPFALPLVIFAQLFFVLFELAFEFGESGANACWRVGSDSGSVQRASGQREIQREAEIFTAAALFKVSVQLHQIRRIAFEELFELLNMPCHDFFDRLASIRLNAAEGNFHRSTLMGGLKYELVNRDACEDRKTSITSRPFRFNTAL